MARLLVSLLGLVLIASVGQAAAQVTPSLFIDPADLTVGLEDGTFEVRLMVEGVTNEDGLGGYTLAMAYDPAIVRGIAITDSGFVQSTENPVTCPASAIDNDEGLLAHFCFTIPIIPLPGPQADEPQVLASVTFEPAGEGSTILDIAEASLNDPQGNAIVAATMNGEVTVRGSTADPGLSDTPPEGDPDAGDTSDSPAPDGLPESGTADDGSDRTVLFVVLLLVGIGGLALVATFLVLRVRKQAS